MAKTVPHPVLRSREAARLGQDGEIVIRGTFTHHLQFIKWGKAEVSVRGWPALEGGTAKRAWIKDYSDHGPLYVEVLEP